MAGGEKHSQLHTNCVPLAAMKWPDGFISLGSKCKHHTYIFDSVLHIGHHVMMASLTT